MERFLILHSVPRPTGAEGRRILLMANQVPTLQSIKRGRHNTVRTNSGGCSGEGTQVTITGVPQLEPCAV